MSQSNRVVSIGDVSVQAKDDPSHLVPVTPWLDGLSCKEPSQSELGALRWMMQKALLKQDMFLLGPAGILHSAFAKYLDERWNMWASRRIQVKQI
eukprot:s3443_g1.t1